MQSTAGPRTRRTYEALRERIRTGELRPGARLPGHQKLADQYGVALVTVRQALAELATDGLISIEHGRGTFVRWTAIGSVLVAESEPMVRSVIVEVVRMAGFEAIEATTADTGLRALEPGGEISVVLADVRLPDREAGTEFIRTVQRRWPEVPVAVITGYPADLEPLQAESECPVLVIYKPFHVAQIAQALRIATGCRPLALTGI